MADLSCIIQEIDGSNMLKKKRNLLLWITAILTVCSFMNASVNYHLSSGILRKRLVDRELPITSDSLYSGIQKDLVRPVFIARQMANNTLLRDWAIDGEKDFDSVTRYLTEIKRKENAVTSFFVSEKTRNYYYADGILKQVDRNRPADAWYFRVREMKEKFDINVDLDASNNDAPTIFVNYCLYDYEGELLGVAGIGLLLDKINQRMRLYEKQYGRKIYFVDQNGIPYLNDDFSFSPNHAVATDDNAVSIRGRDGIRQVAAQILTESTKPVKSVYSLGDTKIQLNSRYIAELKSYLMVELDEKEALAPLRRIFYINLASAASAAVIVFGLVFLIVSQNHRQLEAVASTDVLTGLENRLAIQSHFDQLLTSFDRNKQPFSVLLFDIDHFKAVNDTFGHQAGDDALAQIAEIAKATVSQHVTSRMFRWGGEEFLVTLERTSLESAERIAESLRQAIKDKEIVTRGDAVLSVTVSVGVDTAREGDELGTIVDRVDKALYIAKKKGRDRTEVAPIKPATLG